MDTLLYEAVYAPDLIKLPARHLLRALAAAGVDLTGDLPGNLDVPEFGPVSWYLMGMYDFIKKGRHKAQAERFLARLEVARQRQPTDYERTLELRHERADAFTCFQYAGERPEDPGLFEDLLLVGEFDALLRASAGFDEDDVLEVFDAIAQSSGAQREAAITKLQELAKAGRFLRDEEAA